MKNIILFLLLGSINVVQASQKTENLTVLISGYGHDNGRIVVNLFRKQDDVMGKPFQSQQVSITTDRLTATFENISYGEYALIVFHDENSNGSLDHNIFRLPDEPMGFSGGYVLGFFSGLPSFSKLRFVFSETRKNYYIQIENYEPEGDEYY